MSEDAAAGVPGSLEDGLARALPRLRRHLAGRGRRVPGLEPEDLVQEVVARALRYAGSFDAGRDPWPWLRRLAERVLHDQRAADARREPTTAAPELLTREPARDADPAPRVDARDEVEVLLARLPLREREVLVRFHQKGESVRAIARALACPEGTVKSHLHRARRRLADESPAETKHD